MTLNDFFQDCVRDLYGAEKTLLKATPKLAKAAQSEPLRQALEEHAGDGEEHMRRLEAVAKIAGFPLTGKSGAVAQALVAEASEILKGQKPGPVVDAVVVACARKNAHFEIAAYETAIELARTLDHKEAISMLEMTRDEERKTAGLLARLAHEGIDRAAAEAPPKGSGGMTRKVSVH